MICDRAGTWSLAPAYDLLPAAATRQPGLVPRRATGVLGRFRGLDRDPARLRGRDRVPDPASVTDEVRAAVADWPAHAAAACVPSADAATVAASHPPLTAAARWRGGWAHASR